MQVREKTPTHLNDLFSLGVPAASPFVVAIASAGINVFPDIINAALLAFVLSAAMTGQPWS